MWGGDRGSGSRGVVGAGCRPTIGGPQSQGPKAQGAPPGRKLHAGVALRSPGFVFLGPDWGLVARLDRPASLSKLAMIASTFNPPAHALGVGCDRLDERTDRPIDRSTDLPRHTSQEKGAAGAVQLDQRLTVGYYYCHSSSANAKQPHQQNPNGLRHSRVTHPSTPAHAPWAAAGPPPARRPPCWCCS